MVDIRLLTSSDISALDAFLIAHRDSSMFLRANARRAGLDYRGEPFQAVYAAAIRDERMVGVAAHCWNGMLLMQAPEAAAVVATACVDWSGRGVTGFAGPLEHVHEARAALGLADRSSMSDKN